MNFCNNVRYVLSDEWLRRCTAHKHICSLRIYWALCHQSFCLSEIDVKQTSIEYEWMNSSRRRSSQISIISVNQPWQSKQKKNCGGRLPCDAADGKGISERTENWQPQQTQNVLCPFFSSFFVIVQAFLACHSRMFRLTRWQQSAMKTKIYIDMDVLACLCHATPSEK